VRWFKKFCRWASVEEKNRKPRKYTCLYIRCTEWSQISSGLVGTHLSLLFPSPVLELVCDVEIRFNYMAMYRSGLNMTWLARFSRVQRARHFEASTIGRVNAELCLVSYCWSMGLPVVPTNLPLTSTNVIKVKVNNNNLNGCPIASTRCVTTVGIYAALPPSRNSFPVLLC
jgi:hypothetical protein